MRYGRIKRQKRDLGGCTCGQPGQPLFQSPDAKEATFLCFWLAKVHPKWAQQAKSDQITKKWLNLFGNFRPLLIHLLFGHLLLFFLAMLFLTASGCFWMLFDCFCPLLGIVRPLLRRFLDLIDRQNKPKMAEIH